MIIGLETCLVTSTDGVKILGVFGRPSLIRLCIWGPQRHQACMVNWRTQTPVGRKAFCTLCMVNLASREYLVHVVSSLLPRGGIGGEPEEFGSVYEIWPDQTSLQLRLGWQFTALCCILWLAWQRTAGRIKPDNFFVVLVRVISIWLE